jgi:hypothetical protein
MHEIRRRIGVFWIPVVIFGVLAYSMWINAAKP